MVIYKVVIPNPAKHGIEHGLYDHAQREQKISFLRVAIAKHTFDEQVLACVNDLRHNFKERSLYGDLYEFLEGLKGRWDGVSLKTYVNPNIYFLDHERYRSEIQHLNVRLLAVMNDLYCANNYLQHAIAQGRFYKSP